MRGSVRDPWKGRALSLVPLVLCAFLTAASPEPAAPGARLQVVNQSQFELAELRLHDAPQYLEAANRLARPLPAGDRLDLAAVGATYVTVIRERYSRGPMWALTTAAPLALDEGGAYELQVFDESFRFYVVNPPALDEGAGCACRTAHASAPLKPRERARIGWR